RQLDKRVVSGLDVVDEQRATDGERMMLHLSGQSDHECFGRGGLPAAWTSGDYVKVGNGRGWVCASPRCIRVSLPHGVARSINPGPPTSVEHSATAFCLVTSRDWLHSPRALQLLGRLVKRLTHCKWTNRQEARVVENCRDRFVVFD